MPIAVAEARVAQIESTIATLSPQQNRAASAYATSGTGGIIGSSTGAVPGSAAEQSVTDGFAAQLKEALSASSPDAVAAGTGLSALTGAAGTAAASAAGFSTAGSARGSNFGDRVVSTAKQHLGTPYVWGGESPNGFDCSGLVQYVMDELGVDMPRVARDQAKVGTEVSSLAEAQPGDLLGMRNGSHIAIYLGDNKILHAPQPGENVSIRSLFSWDDIDTVRRVSPAGGASSGSGATRAAFEQLAGA